MDSDKLRARVLAEWRGLPETPFTRDSARPASDAIGKVMAAWGLRDRLREEEVLGAWREVVGELLARESAPKALQRGVLIVRVLQPTVRYDLDRVWKPDILAKLRARFGAQVVRDIKFVVG